MIKQFCIIIFALFCLNASAQRGKDGNITITGPNMVLNSYTFLTQNVIQGSNTINVASTAGFTTGDLILIIQMQGATLRNLINSGLFNETWGAVLDYHNCGRYEFQQINSVGQNQLVLDCALKNSYDTLANANTQIVRVPRYNQFTMATSSSVTCPAWDGKTGGIVAIETLENALINGQISTNGKGFRGGVSDNASVAVSVQIFNMASQDSAFGGEKGEGIGGYQSWYDNWGGRYGRGAAANGGGGGNGHNSGGGGGANAGIGTWNGMGNPNNGSGNVYTPFWELEATNFSNNVSTGGGRGGYSFSMYENDASLMGPGNPAWGGNNRANNGGLGGRPLNNGINSERVFMGGGGGAGDGNDNVSTNGAAGGGIVFIISYANITGTGSVGAAGAQGIATPFPGNDAPGGGGGGGSIILKASGTIDSIITYAHGGSGGSQHINIPEAEGPGGGGGGGYIAHTGGYFLQQVDGGPSGTTNSFSLSEFPANGATRGGQGLNNQNVQHFWISAPGVSICPGDTAQLFASLSGNFPSGTVLKWYNSNAGGTPFHTGASWTTPPLNNTTTYYVGSCPGTYRVPVTVSIFQPPIVNAGNDTSICSGGSVQLSATGGVGYFWAPNATLSNAYAPNPIASPNSNITYVVVATDINGCTNSDDVVVSINPLPQVIANATEPAICLGASTLVYATGGVSYQWSTGQTVNSFTVSPILPTNYIVTASDNIGCSNTAAVVVSIKPLPFAIAGPDTSFCYGSSVGIYASGGTGYSWQPSNTLNNNLIANPIASPNTTTTYTVTISNIFNCTIQEDIVVTVHPLPQVSAGANQSICFGDSAVLNATGGLTYLWSNGDSTQQITVSPTISTTYTVTATDNLGCSNTDDIVVTVLPLPLANAGLDTSICPGTTAQLNASGGINYIWSPSAGLSSTTISNPVASPLSSTTYTVSVTDANGCMQTDNVSITIYPEPHVFIVADTLAGCAPLEVTFNDTASNIMAWSWNFGDPLSGVNNTSTISNPSHTYINSGSYSVALTLTSIYSCSKTEIFNNFITVHPNPIASFVADQSELSVFHPTFTFTNNSQDAVSWFWNFGGVIQATSTDFEPTYTYDEEGTYVVSLLVLSPHGCADSTTGEVIVKPEFTFFIPNVFTPNEDGLNDYFQCVGRNFNNFQMFIYDRWGALIYETNDYNKPWNGKTQNGNEYCVPGVYAYLITVRDFKNRKYNYKGHVTVLW